MSDRTCLYEVLNANGKVNVQKDSSTADIKKAFRVLAMKFHPDRLQGASEAEQEKAANRFSEIQYAYNILSKEDTRAAYDEKGFAGLEDGQEDEPRRGFDFSQADLDELIKETEDVAVSEDRVSVKRKGAKGSTMSKFLNRNKSGDADAAKQTAEKPAPEPPPEKPKGTVTMDQTLRDEFAAFAREKGNTDLAKKIEALEVR
ncbi:MAG: DnaJ domain-containing protein, partial [Pseudomonadota bacterium]